MAWQPSYQSEGQSFAKWLLKEKPEAKIAILYQNDDFGKDYLKGFKDGLGGKTKAMIALEESYETSEPSVDSHVVKMKATGADTVVSFTTPKPAAQAINKIAELNWKPLQILPNVAASVASVIKPAGFENAQGIVSAHYLKDPADPNWENDAGMKQFLAFMTKEYPDGNKLDVLNITGYAFAQTLEQVLKQCGDNLTRENIMKQAASLKDFRTEVLLPVFAVRAFETN
jgi:ABC-type branched-subunit amino acid transport system substrate-binding protein